MEIAKKKDFVEVKYTGYTNGNIFDSNVEEDLKKIDSKGKVRDMIVVVGEGMIVPGFDRELEGKEVGKEYEAKIRAKEGFGERRSELVKTIPLKVFTAKQINPYPGMVLAIDNGLARVITVSGARVTTDFNNPLAGKDLVYKFKIARILKDDAEKAKVLLEFAFRFTPEFEVKGDKVIVKGQKILEKFVEAFKDKAKELLGKDLKFELKEEDSKKKEKTEGKKISEDKKKT
jgi:FKBP-type peptidyl-prolyl cis-trans isomerase 2